MVVIPFIERATTNMLIGAANLFWGSMAGGIAAESVVGGSGLDPLVALVGAIAGAASSFTMLFFWARLITRGQRDANRDLSTQLAAERAENAALRAEAAAKGAEG